MRNIYVQQAVDLIIDLVDQLAEGKVLGRPTSLTLKNIFDNHVASQKGSVKLACAYLAAYSVIDSSWDFNTVPTGTRGKYGGLFW